MYVRVDTDYRRDDADDEEDSRTSKTRYIGERTDCPDFGELLAKV